jgi:hypothetical protein
MDYAKIYGYNRALSFMGREKAHGLWKKAPSRIKKKIGSQALWPQNAKIQGVFGG